MIGAKRRNGGLTAELAAAAVSEFDLWRLRDVRSVEVEPEDVILAEHLVRRIELGLRAPDAVHLALCARLMQPLLTFDMHQAGAARAIGLDVLTLT